MIYELHQTMLKVLKFAVTPECRRTGIGSRMVEKLIDKLSQQRRIMIELEIPETNVSAQLFFSKRGFLAIQSFVDSYLFRYTKPHEQVAVDGSNRISQYYEQMD